MGIKINPYQNLVFTAEVQTELQKNKALTPNAIDKLLDAIDRLNRYGTDNMMLTKKLENLGRDGWWALRIKDSSKNEWRLMFRKIAKKEYGLVLLFRKTTKKIHNRDFDSAVRIAKQEGWL